MKFRPRLQPWMLVSAAWIVPALFAAINRIAQTFFRSGGSVTIQDLIWESGDWFLYAFLTPFVFSISRRYPLVKPFIARRTFLHIVFSLFFCVVWATFGKLLQGALALAFEPESALAVLRSPDFFRLATMQWLSWVFTTFPFGIAVYLCMVGIEHAIRYFIEVRQSEVQMAIISKQLSDARFAALQAQVNPHFLFNTLNTITVLVREKNNDSAVFIIEQLSEVLRMILGSYQAAEVLLGQELELTRRYLNIEKARFSDRLHYRIEIKDSLLFALIPGFALQHLVENAVRHGIARKTESGQLLITALLDGDIIEISVRDDGIGIDPDFVFPAGHGLFNTVERLKLLYGEKASLTLRRENNETIAALRIPYHGGKLELEDESTEMESFNR